MNINNPQSIFFVFLCRFTHQPLHAEHWLFVHFKLYWLRFFTFILPLWAQCLSMYCASICKQRLVIQVIILTVRVPCLQTCSIVEKSLVKQKFLIGRLSLSQSNFFADISLFLFDLLFPLCSNSFHSIFPFYFSLTMVPELLSLFVIFFLRFWNDFVLLNFFHLISCLLGSSS